MAIPNTRTGRRPHPLAFAVLCVAHLQLGATLGAAVMQGDPSLVAQFDDRVAAYVELRNRLSDGLPQHSTSATPEQIVETERLLSARVRAARASARQGDIFTVPIQETFRRALRVELHGRRGANTRGVIMDENPTHLELHINGKYPKYEPLSTVPPNVLRRLPRLPADLEYRFVGVHLVLRDGRTNLIVDYVTNAIPAG